MTKNANPDGTAKRGKFPTVLIAVLLVAIGIAVLLNLTLQKESDGRFLSIESSAPNGAEALGVILQEQGIEIVNVREQSQLQQADANSTVVLTDPGNIMDKDLQMLRKSGAQILILVDGYAYYLIDWGIDAITVQPDAADGFGSPTAEGNADGDFNSPFRSAQENYLRQHSGGAKLHGKCALPAAVQAGRISPVENVFRDYALDSGETQADSACFRVTLADGTEGAALIHAPGKPNIRAFSAPVIFTNTFLAHDGNAAFALNLLGAHEKVYWVEHYYTPSEYSAEDLSQQLGNNQGLPKWWSILAIGALLSGGWLALQQSRRFGKLVPEPMPVVVPSAESDSGRAQLYAHGRDYPYLGRILRNYFLARFTNLRPQPALAATSQRRSADNSAASAAAAQPASLQPAHTNFDSHSQLSHDATNSTSATHYSSSAELAASAQIVDALHSRSHKSREELAELLSTREIKTKSDLVKLQEELEALAKELQ